jgi:hypothetical protein
VFIRYLCRALRRAISAGNTFFHIDIAGIFDDIDSKVTLTAGNRFDV